MLYTLSNIEKKTTSTGKQKADVTLTNPTGTQVGKVTIWGDFPNFANLQDGMTVDGDYSEKMNGTFTNRTLYPAKQASYGGNKGGGVAKAQERKIEGIAKAQDRKDESIKESATFRDATTMAVAIYNLSKEDLSSEDLHNIWLRERKFLLDNWEVKDTMTSPGYNGEAPIDASGHTFLANQIKNMKAFHDDIKIKNKYISRVKSHAKGDEIVQGVYWENGKGCAVGCTIENDDPQKSQSGWHQRYEEALGIPRVIARLEDKIFEGLPNEIAKDFPLRFLNSVNIGADLSLVLPKFFVWLLSDPTDGVIKYVDKYKDCKKAIKQVAKLYDQTVGGKVVKKEAWLKAKNAAYTAYDAAYAAYDAAADAAAAYATYTAYDATYTAYDATYAAYDAAADAAAAYATYTAYAAAYDAYAALRSARYNHYIKMADKLIEILKETK